MIKRFCSWCGKVEHTETCQSKSLNRLVSEILESNIFKNKMIGIQKAYKDEMKVWHKNEKNGLEK